MHVHAYCIIYCDRLQKSRIDRLPGDLPAAFALNWLHLLADAP